MCLLNNNKKKREKNLKSKECLYSKVGTESISTLRRLRSDPNIGQKY